jgi:hypothetical protein
MPQATDVTRPFWDSKGFECYIRQTKTGKLCLDKAKFDGKYLISTSDDHITIEDVILGYKLLPTVQRQSIQAYYLLG